MGKIIGFTSYSLLAAMDSTKQTLILFFNKMYNTV